MNIFMLLLIFIGISNDTIMNNYVTNDDAFQIS